MYFKFGHLLPPVLPIGPFVVGCVWDVSWVGWSCTLGVAQIHIGLKFKVATLTG